MLRHAQGVIVCLALVTSFGDFLDSSESDCKMVAIVPETNNDRREAYLHGKRLKERISKNALHRTIALLFKVKRGV